MTGQANTLLLLRHGQSTTNADGIFTGWLDVPLSDLGRHEATDAGRLVHACGYRPDFVHTSTLLRSIETADIVLAELSGARPRLHRTWRLNERHYGSLTGRKKADVLGQVGSTRYKEWRNSLTVAPPPLTPENLAALRRDGWPVDELAHAPMASESLGDVLARVSPYWVSTIAPQLASGATVLLVAHGNSLRALCTLMDGLSQAELTRLRLPTGQPIAYSFSAGSVFAPQPRGGRPLADYDRQSGRSTLLSSTETRCDS